MAGRLQLLEASSTVGRAAGRHPEAGTFFFVSGSESMMQTIVAATSSGAAVSLQAQTRREAERKLHQSRVICEQPLLRPGQQVQHTFADQPRIKHLCTD